MNPTASQPSPLPPSAHPGRGIRVMKFGGTSVANADRLREIVRLAGEALAADRVLLVASALSGITNILVEGAQAAAAGRPCDAVDRFRARHRGLLAGLSPELGPARVGELEQRLGALETELQQLLQGITLLRSCPPRSLARLSSLGEQASCALLAALLQAHGLPCLLLDPRVVLPCEGDPLEATPLPGRIRDAFAPFRAGDAPLALLPGFFGGDAGGEPLLLGRGGSDLSAALAAAALDAGLLEIWTDVDGIFTADPRVVPEAACLEELSYEEAMELAHFGAKVLHPRTLAPVRGPGIPVRVRNSFHPGHPGTLVRAGVGGAAKPAQGLSLLQDVALVDLAGPGMRGVPGVAARAFQALAAKDISVVLITQGSSECALTICVKESESAAAAEALERAFEAERAAGMVDPIALRRELCILSLVGDGMRHRTGIAGAFFGALGDEDCNVVAIAQGSSERSISAVLAAPEGARGMGAVHARFFDHVERLDLCLLGVGLVGKQFLVQLKRQQARLRARGVELRLCAVGNSRRMVLDAAGLDPDSALEALKERGVPLDLEALRRFGAERRPANPVFVDCSSAEALADAYSAFAAAGFHLVSASKKLNSGPLARYKALRAELARHHRRFHFETNVGAGLPVLGTLRDLLAGGDRVRRIEGILSGSLSFIFGLLEEGVPFSEAVRRARDAGFTEPDPRDDLSGLDVARKALILHRELGGTLELEQVRVEGALPAGFDAGGNAQAFLDRLPALDAAFAARVAELKRRGLVLRYGATVEEGGCRVGLLEVEAEHPLASVRGGENALSFSSEAYSPRPLVVRGYGAGATVTAAGVLADVMRLVQSVQL